MTLEYEKFKSLAEEFISISRKLGDEWFIRTQKDNPTEHIYLEKRIVKANIDSLESYDEHTEFCDKEIEQFEPTITTFVYHIVYSQSYSVPVLCFIAHNQNGKSLTLDEIWKMVPNCYSNESDNKWDMITQQEHPKLGFPCFSIHPCHTKDLLSPCSTSNYIITWLSVVGPVVGLSLPLEYAKFT